MLYVPSLSVASWFIGGSQTPLLRQICVLMASTVPLSCDSWSKVMLSDHTAPSCEGVVRSETVNGTSSPGLASTPASPLAANTDGPNERRRLETISSVSARFMLRDGAGPFLWFSPFNLETHSISQSSSPIQ